MEGLFSELYKRSDGARFGISLSDFTQIVQGVVEHRAEEIADRSALQEFLTELRVDDLVLARACATGNVVAWDVFLSRYREGLYSAALSIAKNDALAHEMADSIYADLLGADAREGVRTSKLNSYMGLGSLQGWLRTTLAHTYIDRYRMDRPLVSLDDGQDDDEPYDPPAPAPEEVREIDPRLESATDAALAALGAEDRYLLSSWFLHGRTLAELGRALGVHESTISRRIDKLTGGLRKKILSALVRQGMSRRQAEEALESDVRDLQLDIRRRLEENSQDSPAGPSLEGGKRIVTKKAGTE